MSNSKPQIGARVPEDRYEKFDAYQDERNLSQTEALNRLIKTGLEEKQSEKTWKTEIRQWVSDYLAIMGAASALLAVWLGIASARALLGLGFAAIAIASNLISLAFQVRA